MICQRGATQTRPERAEPFKRLKAYRVAQSSAQHRFCGAAAAAVSVTTVVTCCIYYSGRGTTAVAAAATTICCLSGLLGEAVSLFHVKLMLRPILKCSEAQRSQSHTDKSRVQMLPLVVCHLLSCLTSFHRLFANRPVGKLV